MSMGSIIALIFCLIGIYYLFKFVIDGFKIIKDESIYKEALDEIHNEHPEVSREFIEQMFIKILKVIIYIGIALLILLSCFTVWIFLA